ncbi:E3 ubiquitin-protein ligase GW2-like [Typha latifolia]|uniref:E3 ubiquitin-protein ligase GW2-like n=1 Tax=Typha latifolia TaxID=4733 RepID=UPI003C2F1F85
MGNKIGRKRQVVDEKYTRPQGLYEHRDIDEKKLRKLILESKLAPCYPGDEDCAADLEECPICFLYYPSLNRSKCCAKGICTECFLQMKPTHSSRPTQCPFCKTSNYAVEYRGMKTKEERSMEQVEEQRVIEAQIRVRQQELQDEAERMKRECNKCSSNRIITPAEADCRDICSTSFSVPPFRCTTQGNKLVSFQPPFYAPTSIQPSLSRHNRDNNFDHDLEEIMIMEAIWFSIQEQGTLGNPGFGGSMLLEPPCPEFYNMLVEPPYPDRYSHAVTPAEVCPGGFACTVATLAEHQHMNGNYTSLAGNNAQVFDMLRQSGSIPSINMSMMDSSPGSWIEVPPNCRRIVREEGECSTDQWSDVTEVGTSYAGSDTMVDGVTTLSLPESFNMAAGHLIPESVEEQMMLGMAVSLAEARARSAPGLTWL